MKHWFLARPPQTARMVPSLLGLVPSESPRRTSLQTKLGLVFQCLFTAEILLPLVGEFILKFRWDDLLLAAGGL